MKMLHHERYTNQLASAQIPRRQRKTMSQSRPVVIENLLDETALEDSITT
jgi:hypothetical protein